MIRLRLQLRLEATPRKAQLKFHAFADFSWESLGPKRGQGDFSRRQTRWPFWEWAKQKKPKENKQHTRTHSQESAAAFCFEENKTAHMYARVCVCVPRVQFVAASDAGELKIGNEGNAEPPRKVLMSNARVLITNAGSAVVGQIRETTTTAAEAATKQRHKLCLHTQILQIKKKLRKIKNNQNTHT